jgi:hypothetical protein
VNEKEQPGCFSCAAVVVVLVLCLVCSGFFAFTNPAEHVGRVGSTWVKHTHDGPDRFFVSIEKDDGTTEVFQVKDSAWRLRFNSADDFARLKPGTRVRLHSNGYRVGWLSWFPNANAIEVLTDEDESRKGH